MAMDATFIASHADAMMPTTADTENQVGCSKYYSFHIRPLILFGFRLRLLETVTPWLSSIEIPENRGYCKPEIDQHKPSTMGP